MLIIKLQFETVIQVNLINKTSNFLTPYTNKDTLILIASQEMFQRGYKLLYIILIEYT